MIHLPLCRPGTRVLHEGRHCTIGHVFIGRGQLMAQLQETGTTVDAAKVRVEPTRIVLRRYDLAQK